MTTALMGIGIGLTAVGKIYEGVAGSQAAQFNQGVAERNKGISLDMAKSEAARVRRGAARSIGQMRANYGASGLVATGSVLDVFEDSYAEAELDVKTVLYKGEVQALGFEDEANLQKQKATNSIVSGVLGAGSVGFRMVN
jgi:hypothetical protein